MEMDPAVADFKRNMRYSKDKLYKLVAACEDGDEYSCQLATDLSAEIESRLIAWDGSLNNPKNQPKMTLAQPKRFW